MLYCTTTKVICYYIESSVFVLRRWFVSLSVWSLILHSSSAIWSRSLSKQLRLISSSTLHSYTIHNIYYLMSVFNILVIWLKNRLRYKTIKELHKLFGD